MNCLECQAWLQRRLDGEPVTPTDAVEQHWSECATCREQHAAATQLLDGLKQLPRPRPAPGFAAALAATIVQDRRHRLAKMRRRVYLTAALAASIMLMLLAGYWWIPRTNPDEPLKKQPIVKGIEKKVEPPAPKDPVEPKRQEPPNVLASLTDRWVDTTRDHAKVMLAATNLDAVEDLPIDKLQAAGVREAGQEVSDGVRAVTRNARRALDYFARELPMPEMGTHGN